MCFKDIYEIIYTVIAVKFFSSNIQSAQAYVLQHTP